MSAEQPITAGLIGAGGMGRHLAEVTNEMSNCSVSFVCDPNKEHAQAAATSLSAEISPSLDELLSQEDVDAVIIAAPNHLHAELAIAAAEAGKHIFCEKPMALNVVDARRMIEAAQANSTKLMIGQVLRYMFPFVWIIEFITQGNLGEPIGMQVTRMDGPWGDAQSWRMRRNQCGGPLLEIGAHEVDLIRCILGEATNVSARLEQLLTTDTDYEDFAAVTISFDNGQLAQLLEGQVSHTSIYDGKIFCSQGTLLFAGWGEYLAYQRKGDDELTIVDREDVAGNYEDAYQRELGEFFEAIRQDTEPTIPGVEGLRNVEIAEAAWLSQQRSGPVPLPL